MCHRPCAARVCFRTRCCAVAPCPMSHLGPIGCCLLAIAWLPQPTSPQARPGSPWPWPWQQAAGSSGHRWPGGCQRRCQGARRCGREARGGEEERAGLALWAARGGRSEWGKAQQGGKCRRGCDLRLMAYGLWALYGHDLRTACEYPCGLDSGRSRRHCNKAAPGTSYSLRVPKAVLLFCFYDCSVRVSNRRMRISPNLAHRRSGVWFRPENPWWCASSASACSHPAQAPTAAPILFCARHRPV
jgi:hypothetical protein